jgi:hypothetical protein
MTIARRRFAHHLLGISSVVLALTWAFPAKAGLLSNLSGNTYPFFSPPPINPPATQGFVNFAVFDKTSTGVPTPGDNYSTGFANFDTILTTNFGPNALDGDYLYLYQTVNTATVSPELSQNSVQVVPSGLVARGILPGIGFQDAQGAVSATNPLGNTAATPGFFSSASVGVSVGAGGTILTSDSSLVAPQSLILSGTSLQANYGSPTFLPVGRVGSLFGYTSDLGPDIRTTAIIDGGISANGQVYGGVTPATVIPEPSNLMLAGVAGACGLLGWYRRRLKTRSA